MKVKDFAAKTLLVTLFMVMNVSCARKPAPIVMKGHISYTKDKYLSKYSDVGTYHKFEDVKTVDFDSNPIKPKKISLDASFSEKKPVQDLTKKRTVAQSNLKKKQVKTISIPNNATANLDKDAGEVIVRGGDTVLTISKRYNIPTKTIVNANNLKSPYRLTAGQKLILPGVEKSLIAKQSTIKAKELKKQITESNVDTTRAVIVKGKAAPKITKNQALSKKNNTFMWPVKGKVVSKFGPKKNGYYNDGIKIKASKNTPFKSAEDGIVTYSGSELKNYGNLILVKHSNNWFSAYAHCNSVEVEKGDIVSKGQIIGYVGNTGNADDHQLYFGLRKGKKAVNPEAFLK